MGRGMVKNIVEKGSYATPLNVYNRTFSRAEDLVSTFPSGKATAVQTIAEAVEQADIIFTCVGDDQAINDTIASALQVPQVKGKLFVECSTVHPDTTNALAEKVLKAGAEFVACPVFGAPAMAQSGQLICVLAGAASSIEKVKPFCKGVMGRENIDFSDQPHGNALRMKLIGNTFILSMVETLSEGHTLAEKSGLGSDNLHQFIAALFPGPYTAYSQRMMQGDYYKKDALFNAPLARKDARHVRDLAAKSGVKMDILEVADRHLAQVVEEQGDKGDIAGIYGAVRKENGLPYEN